MKNKAIFGLALVMPLQYTTAHAYDVNDSLSLGGVLAVTLQCQNVSHAPGVDDACRTAAPLQPELSFRPTPVDEVFLKLGFAAGHGINDITPFAIAPWAADLEDDVKDINGRGRDHLLTAWYKHTFQFADHHQLGATFGIIDATDYLGENAYSNDEYTQFLNPAFTNGSSGFLPSYDLGVALDWDAAPFSLRAVLMDIGENDDGNDYRFYGLQAGYTLENSLGTGHYRLTIAGASQDFLNPAGTRLEHRASALLSFDQEFGALLGGWLRVGAQTDDAAVDYNAVYSGGLDIKGAAWGRPLDNIGLGYAYVSGGNLDIDKSHVGEAYYRWQLDEVYALTADAQYQRDYLEMGGGPRGWTFGLRATAEF